MPNPFGYLFSPTEKTVFTEKIAAAGTIAILPHSKADGDALGSAEALRLVLQKLGKEARIICPDEPKVTFPCPLKIAKYTKVPDLLISVDCGSLERCFYPAEFQNIFFVNIDHHISNPNFADLNIVRNVPSNCELLAALLLATYGDEVFTPEVAESLLFGILSDTQIFTTSNILQSTLAITAFLLEKGANYQKVKAAMSAFISPLKLNLWANVIMAAKLKEKGRVLLLRVDETLIAAYQLQSSMFTGFINMVAKTVETDVVAFMSAFEQGDLDVSLRAKQTDVAAVAEAFGGGGHKRAAGFKIKNKSMDEAEALLLAKLKIMSYQK